MKNINAVIYLFLISTLLSTCSCSRREIEDSEENGTEDSQRRFVSKYLRQFAVRGDNGKSVCTGSSLCGTFCDPREKHEASTTCGLVCYVDKWDNIKIGSTGTCLATSKACDGAASTFCPGGSFTVNGNDLKGNSNYFDCANNAYKDNGASCGSRGGCCVRLAGVDKLSNQYYCLTCNK